MKHIFPFLLAFLIIYETWPQPEIDTIFYEFVQIEGQESLLVDVDALADSVRIEYTFWYEDTTQVDGEQYIDYDMIPTGWHMYYKVDGLITDTVRIMRGAHDMDIDVRAWMDGLETRKSDNVRFE